MKRKHLQKYRSLSLVLEGHSQGKALDPTRKRASYWSNSVRIVTQRSNGSGILLTRDGYFITNDHVLPKGDQPLHIKIPLEGDDNITTPIERVYARSTLYDLCLAKAHLSFAQVPNEVVLATSRPRRGDKIRVYGYDDNLMEERRGEICPRDPLSGEEKLREMNIRLGPDTLYERRENSRLYSTTQVEPGWSGAPVVLERTGELVGITAWSAEFARNAGLFGLPEWGHGFVVVEKVRGLLQHFLNGNE
jgi:S1-C subfamily serine protease